MINFFIFAFGLDLFIKISSDNLKDFLKNRHNIFDLIIFIVANIHIYLDMKYELLNLVGILKFS